MSRSKTVEVLSGQYPARDGILKQLRSLGFTYVADHGDVDPQYLREGSFGPVAPEGFCLLGDGRVGFCDIWGGTWAAPAAMQ